MDKLGPMESFDRNLQALDDSAFMDVLTRNNIELRVAQNQLKVNAAPGVLNEELKRELGRRKESLLAVLKDNSVNNLRRNDLGIRARRRLSPAGQWTPQLQYWKTKLDGVTGLLELPFSRPRHKSRTSESSTKAFFIPSAVAVSLREIASSETVSFDTVLLAAFSLLLYRYTDRDDFCLGVPVMRRQRRNEAIVDDVVENFAVIRCQTNPSTSFGDLVQLINGTVLDAYANSSIPLARLLGELPIVVEQGTHPLFQFMFGLDLSRPTGCLVHDMGLVDNLTLDLVLYLDTYSDVEVSGHFRYRTDLFNDESVAILAESYISLLSAIAEEPDSPVGELSVLSATQKERMLVQWNQTQMEFPATTTVHSLFEQQVEQTPDAIAIVTGNRTISYSVLNSRANQIAHLLLQRGVNAGDVVGICMRRSIDMLAVMLAVLKAGAAYLPLDPAYPAQRLEAMLEDSKAKFIVADNEARVDASVSRRNVICTDAEISTIAKLPQSNMEISVSANDLAYVIYTSGSTGRPKGIAIEHHSTVSLLCWGKHTFSKQELTRVLASTSICFDLSVFELFLPLSVGSTVVLIDDILQLARIDTSIQPTLVNTVPSAIAAFIASATIPQSVRCVNLAGEPLSAALVKKIEQQVPYARIFDLYGPTETTTYSTFCRRESDSPATIGRPLANTHIYLLDARCQPVPPGVPGQIFIGGEGVARGYLNRHDLTKERFVTIEHLPSLGRLYSTGDLGRYRTDGNVEYLGRIDQQVKIRGFRVELGEIESILQQHPRVRESVALIHKDDEVLGTSLKAYVTLSAGPVEVEELIAFQEKFLPAYMVAREIVILDNLPMTLNGKIDKKALANTKQIASMLSLREPRLASEIERKLTAIWEQNFKRKPIGLNDDFFALGGHSLLAFQIFNDIEKRFKVSLMLSVLFKAPTIRLLAEEIERKGQPTKRFALH